MSFISYAQNFEDVMLWRALKHIDKGFYIDVGANDPDFYSVTKAFYERGWNGINIEPVSEWFEKLLSGRTRDINLQIAAGAKLGEMALYEIPQTGLSTCNEVFADEHVGRGFNKVKQTVPVDTLTNICNTYKVGPVHFLKIDVEGAERFVLEGLDFSKIRPWIIILEATLPLSQIEVHHEWESLLEEAHYQYVYGDGLNRFYVAHEHSEIKKKFNYPPNSFDGFVKITEVSAVHRAEEAEKKLKEAYALLKQFGVEVSDATVPLTVRIHRLINRLSTYSKKILKKAVRLRG